MISTEIEKGDVVYWGRCVPRTNIYNVVELKVRTVVNEEDDNWFVGVDKRDKQAHLFGFTSLGKCIFKNRDQCLKYVKEMEKTAPKLQNDETYYDEGMEI